MNADAARVKLVNVERHERDVTRVTSDLGANARTSSARRHAPAGILRG